MRADRLAGLAVVTTSAAALGAMSGHWLVPTLATVVALAGATGRIRLRVTRQRELICMLAVAVAFAAMWRIAPFEPQAVQGLVLFSVMHALGQFWLAWMALKLIITRDAGLSVALPVLGVAVFIAAGDVYVDADTERVYQVLSLASVCSMMLFFAARRHTARGHAGRRSMARRVTLVIALGLAMVGGAAGSTLLYHYQREADQFIRKLSLRWVPSTGLGFSSVSRLGDLDELRASQMADRISLRVVCDGPPPYLRGLAYDTYRKSTWHWESNQRTVAPAGSLPDELGPLPVGMAAFNVGPGEGPWDAYDIWPAPDRTEAIFAPLHTTWSAAPTDTVRASGAGTLSSPDLPAGAGYRVWAPRKKPPPQALSQQQHARYTAAEQIDPRVHELAADVFAGRTTTIEKIHAVESFFEKNFRYHIGIRVPSGQDPLTYFLTERPGAHCEYFATAATVLLRLGGVPCRYVTGFVATERSETGGYWVARNRDAHAWVEAWVPGQGWTTVEPTPPAGVPQQRQRGALAWLWDWLQLKWQQIKALLMVGGFGGVMSWLGQQVLAGGRWLIGQPAGWAVLVATTAGVGLWWTRRRRSRRRRGRQRQTDPHVVALQQLLARVDKRMARRGLVRLPGQTIHAFARLLTAPATATRLDRTAELQAIAQWYLEYADARYDPQRAGERVEALRASADAIPRKRIRRKHARG